MCEYNNILKVRMMQMFDDDVIEYDFNDLICEPDVPWVDDDTLPNEDMIPDNEFIRG